MRDRDTSSDFEVKEFDVSGCYEVVCGFVNDFIIRKTAC